VKLVACPRYCSSLILTFMLTCLSNSRIIKKIFSSCCSDFPSVSFIEYSFSLLISINLISYFFLSLISYYMSCTHVYVCLSLCVFLCVNSLWDSILKMCRKACLQKAKGEAKRET
jgi:hypothetical protein